MLPVRVLFLGGLHNQGPASRSLLLLADCCLQPNPTAWRNVKYSLLNCRAGVGLEPYQAFTAEEYYTPNFKHGKTKSTSQSRIRRAFCHILPHTLPEIPTLLRASLLTPFVSVRFLYEGKHSREHCLHLKATIDSRKPTPTPCECLQTSAKYFFFFFFYSQPRSCTGKGLSFLAWQDFWRSQPAAPSRPLPRCCSFLHALREPGCLPTTVWPSTLQSTSWPKMQREK